MSKTTAKLPDKCFIEDPPIIYFFTDTEGSESIFLKQDVESIIIEKQFVFIRFQSLKEIKVLKSDPLNWQLKELVNEFFNHE